MRGFAADHHPLWRRAECDRFLGGHSGLTECFTVARQRRIFTGLPPSFHRTTTARSQEPLYLVVLIPYYSISRDFLSNQRHVAC